MGRRIAKKRGLKRKKRTSIEGSVKDALDNYFHSEPKPTLEAIASLADSLNMKREVVRIWFCNQRHKEKRKKLPTTKSPESLRRTRSAARMLTMRNEILDGSTEPIKDCVCSATKNDSVSVQSTTVESSGIDFEPLDPPLLLRMDGCEITSSTNDVDERPKILSSCLPDSIVLTSNIFTGHGPSEDPYRNGRLWGSGGNLVRNYYLVFDKLR